MKHLLKAAMVAVACAIIAPAFMGHAKATTHHFTDRQVFEGLVLDHGPVAALVEPGANAAQWSPAQERAVRVFEAALSKKRPSFFHDFSENVRSANPQRVETALVNARGLLTVRTRAKTDVVPVTITVNWDDMIWMAESQSIVVSVSQNTNALIVEQPSLKAGGSFALESFARTVATDLQS